jgi:hypothetical protein
MRVVPPLFAAALGACAGVTDPLNRITGHAPEDGSCRIDIVDRDSGRVLHSEQVRGNFSAGFGLKNDDYPRKVDILGVCDGKTTRAFRNVVPGSIGRTEMGSIDP